MKPKREQKGCADTNFAVLIVLFDGSPGFAESSPHHGDQLAGKHLRTSVLLERICKFKGYLSSEITSSCYMIKTEHPMALS